MPLTPSHGRRAGARPHPAPDPALPPALQAAAAAGPPPPPAPDAQGAPPEPGHDPPDAGGGGPGDLRLEIRPALGPAARRALAGLPHDWRSRHPVVAVSLNSAMRDTLGQGVGRSLGAVVLACFLSHLHSADPALREYRESLMAWTGSGLALLASGVAGIHTGNMLRLTVHRRDEAALQRSALWMAGLLPPLMLVAGLLADWRFGGRPRVAWGAAQALSRVVQYVGRDTAGQSWTAAMQYRQWGWSPGFRLRVLQADGRALAEVDPAAFDHFTAQRLLIASFNYAMMCVGLFTLALWWQPRMHEPGQDSPGFEDNFRGYGAWIIATVALEALDGINGVVAHQIQAWRQGLTLALNEEETQVDNLPEFIATHAMARTATNGLQDLAGALARGIESGAFSALWFLVQIVPRTIAQVLTEPRGFLANTSIETRQAQTRAALTRLDRERERAAQVQARGPAGLGLPPAPAAPAAPAVLAVPVAGAGAGAGAVADPDAPPQAPPPSPESGRRVAWAPAPGAPSPRDEGPRAAPLRPISEARQAARRRAFRTEQREGGSPEGKYS